MDPRNYMEAQTLQVLLGCLDSLRSVRQGGNEDATYSDAIQSEVVDIIQGVLCGAFKTEQK